MLMMAAMICCTSCMSVKRLKPSDNIVKNEYKMEAFDKVDIDLVANVKIVQSNEGDHRVLLKCPDNYVDLFDFKVEANELKLKFAEDMHESIEAKDVAIIVRTPMLLQIDSEGVGNITIDKLNTPSLRIESEGVSNIHIKSLLTESLHVDSEGVGNIELEGSATKAILNSNGVGNIKAGQLNAENVKADINGVGNIVCFASNQIIGSVNGVGSLKYGGHPKDKHLKRNGVGSITEL